MLQIKSTEYNIYTNILILHMKTLTNNLRCRSSILMIKDKMFFIKFFRRKSCSAIWTVERLIRIMDSHMTKKSFFWAQYKITFFTLYTRIRFMGFHMIKQYSFSGVEMPTNITAKTSISSMLVNVLLQITWFFKNFWAL